MGMDSASSLKGGDKSLKEGGKIYYKKVPGREKLRTSHASKTEKTVRFWNTERNRKTLGRTGRGKTMPKEGSQSMP